MSPKPKDKAGRPSAAMTKVVDGALWAVGAGVVGFLLHRLFPSEPTVVVLRNPPKHEEDKDED